MSKLPNRKIRMYEVASLANVSQSAVSRYINDTGPLSQEMRTRIETAIDKLGFVIDTEHASRFSRRKVLGILLPIHLGWQYFSDLEAVFEMYANKAGYHSMSFRPNFSSQSLIDILDEACNERIAGFFVPSLPHTSLTDEEVRFIAESECPIIMVSEFEKPYQTLNCIILENKAAAELAVNTLTEAGCKQLAYLTPVLTVNKSAAQRAVGFLKAVEQAGLAPDKQIISEVPLTEALSAKMGYNAAKAAFAKNESIDGLLCWTDIFAAGAMWFLAQTGRRVPQDTKVATFNDEYARLLCPPLTTLTIPTEQIVQNAVEQLCRMQEPAERMITRQIHLSLTLIERTSTQQCMDGFGVIPY